MFVNIPIIDELGSIQVFKDPLKHSPACLPRYFSDNEERKWRNPLEIIKTKKNIVNAIIKDQI